MLNGCAGGYYANSSCDFGTSSSSSSGGSSSGGSSTSNSTANCISGSLGGDVETYMATLVSTNACASVTHAYFNLFGLSGAVATSSKNRNKKYLRKRIVIMCTCAISYMCARVCACVCIATFV